MSIRRPSKKMRIVGFLYYTCSECGRQIDSYDYYTYGKCEYCR